MDALIVQFNAAVSGGIALVLTWMVLSRRVSDGIVIKTGLILMALGFGSKILALYDGFGCDDLTALTRSNLLVHLGLLIAVAGYLLRRRAGERLQRRSTDWAELDTRPIEGGKP